MNPHHNDNQLDLPLSNNPPRSTSYKRRSYETDDRLDYLPPDIKVVRMLSQMSEYEIFRMPRKVFDRLIQLTSL